MAPVEVVLSGIGGLFPESQDFDQFREHILQGEPLASPDGLRWAPGALGAARKVTSIKDTYKFDNTFYAIHRRLAEVIDPADRLVFERTIEAIMDAGLDPAELNGSNSQVYTANWVSEAETVDTLESPNTYSIMGCNKSMLPNRISFFLNLNGPSCALAGDWTVGLTALQRASSAIRDGACDTAIVGAAGMAFRPGNSRLLQGMGLLSQDGSCRPFSKDGEGGFRGEAVVVLVLQRADQARRVRAHLAVAADCYLGQREAMLQPSSDVIKTFLKDVYRRAGVDPLQVAAAHLTGTGQPELDGAELEAVAAVLCSSRSSALPVFSVPSVAGLADVASPLLAVVAAAIVLERRLVPAVRTASNNLLQPLRDGAVEVSSQPRALRPGGGAVAVSCVGLSGSVGHAVLRDPPRPQPRAAPPSPAEPRLVVAQGRSEQQVEEVVRRIAAEPFHPEYIRLTQDMFCTRKYLSYDCRAFAILPQDEKSIEVKVGRLSGDRPLWLVFSGMGSQWAGMGAGLMQLPTFAATVERLHAVLEPRGVDLKHVLTVNDNAVFDNVLHSFVGIAAVQIGLTNILRDLEVPIDGMLGHSVGELGCAYADGCLTEEQTILAAHARGRASLDANLVPGMMCAVGKSYLDVQPLLPPTVDVACHNSQDNCTLSGPAGDMQLLVKDLQSRGIFARIVNVANIAYHSRYIRPAAPLLLNYLKQVITEPKARSSRWVSSSVAAERADEPHARLCSAEYHTNNLLSSVLFEEAFRAVPESAVVLEVAPHGLLQAIIRRMLQTGGTSLSLTSRGSADQRGFLLNAVGMLFLHGVPARVSALSPSVALPVPPGTPSTSCLATWDHSSNWTDFKHDFANAIMNRGVLLSMLPLQLPIMSERGTQYCPAAIILERVWREVARGKSLEETPVVFENLRLSSPRMSENSASDMTMRFQWLSATGSFEVSRCSGGSGGSSGSHRDCVLRGRARVAEQTDLQALSSGTPGALPSGPERLRLDADDLYAELADRGLDFDTPLRALQRAVVCENEWRAESSLASGWGAFLCSLLQLQVLGDASGTGPLVAGVIRRAVLDPAQLRAAGGNVTVHKSLVLGSMWAAGLRVDGVRGLQQQQPDQDEAAEVHLVPHGDAQVSESAFLRDVCFLALENALDIGRSLVVLEVTQPGGERPVQRLAAAVQRTLQLAAGEAASVALVAAGPGAAGLDTLRGRCALVVAAAGTVGAVSVLEAAAAGRAPTSPRMILVAGPPRHTGTQLSVLTEHHGTQHSLQLLVQDVQVPHLQPQVTLLSAEELPPAAPPRAGPLWLVWRTRPLAGVLATIAAVRAQRYAARAKILIILDPEAPPFTADNPAPLYADRMRLGLAVNILLQGGRWGGARLRGLEVPPLPEQHPPLRSASSALSFLAVSPTAVEGVQDYCGDLPSGRVMGVARSGRPDEVLQWPVPESWSPGDAASAPSAYAAAYHALCVLHRGRPGCAEDRSVLVLDGALPSSEAAIRVAAHLGLRVFTTTASTTAGGAARVLRRLPCVRGRHVLPEERFEVELRMRTHGRGADVVLCPDNQDVSAALRCVANNGLLVLLGGHRHIQDRSIDTIQFLRSVRVCRGGAAALLAANTNTRRAVAEAVRAGIEAGVVRPVSSRCSRDNKDRRGSCLILGSAEAALAAARSLSSAGWSDLVVAVEAAPRTALLPSPPTLLPCPRDAAEAEAVLRQASDLTGTLDAVVILASSEVAAPLVSLVYEAVRRRHPKPPLVVVSEAGRATPTLPDDAAVLHLHGPLRAVARMLPRVLLQVPQLGTAEILIRQSKQEWALLRPRPECGGESPSAPAAVSALELPTLAPRLGRLPNPRREPVPLVAVLGCDLDMATLRSVARSLMSPLLVLTARPPNELAREVLRVQPRGPWALFGGALDGSLLASVAHLLSPPAPPGRGVTTSIVLLDRRGLWPSLRIRREKLVSCSGLEFTGPLHFLKITYEPRSTLKMSEMCSVHTSPEDFAADIINDQVLSMAFMVPARYTGSK